MTALTPNHVRRRDVRLVDEDAAFRQTLGTGRLATLLFSKPLEHWGPQSSSGLAIEDADPQRSNTGRSAAIRVLLLEDSPSDALLLQHAIESLVGFETTHVVRLADAVRLLHEETFDTVITDLTLPDARGLDAVLRLRDCAPEATLVVCSSVADDMLALRVIELGAQDFLVKGASDPELLGRTIRFARVRRQAERRLARLALSDPLTGLCNRVAFAERLEHALARAKRHETRLGVMYIDLDGFKAVNDAQGHDVGDTLLQQVAEQIRSCVRDYDVVARLGGDEFAVLVTNLGESTLEVTAERVVRAIEATGGADSRAAVTASVGLAAYPENGDEVGLLLRHADQAMYSAKRAGKNRTWRPDPGGPL